MIIGFRTDNPTAELSVCLGRSVLERSAWQAHRQMAETIHGQLESLLRKHQATLPDISGIVVYEGPGSFTGLRIGISVANALAYACQVPIVGTTGDDWLEDGLAKLETSSNDRVVVPEYGAPVHITVQKK